MFRLHKRDGAISYGLRNPDGSLVEVPVPEGQTTRWAPPVTENHIEGTELSGRGSVKQFLREIGRRGGQARAARHSRTEISEWGRTRRKQTPGT